MFVDDVGSIKIAVNIIWRVITNGKLRSSMPPKHYIHMTSPADAECILSYAQAVVTCREPRPETVLNSSL